MGNGDANSHMCKVCFESPTAAILLPCRHFCCKSFWVSFFFSFPFRCTLTLFSSNNLTLLQCVNLVHLLVPSALFVEQRLQIGYLHSPLNTVLTPPMKVMFWSFFPVHYYCFVSGNWFLQGNSSVCVYRYMPIYYHTNKKIHY